MASRVIATGCLKDGPFYVGHRRPFQLPSGARVDLIKEEMHPIYGKRYMVEGYGVWFEANCFRWVV
jgi:hypothetical protein